VLLDYEEPWQIYEELLAQAESGDDTILIPAGTFQMGCDSTNPSENCYSDEHPCTPSTWTPTT